MVESYEVGLWNFESTVGSPIGRLSKVIRNRKHGTRAEGGGFKKKKKNQIQKSIRWKGFFGLVGWLVGWSGEIDWGQIRAAKRKLAGWAWQCV